MKYRVFIDGESGTTGLRLRGRLEKRDDIVLLKPDPERHRDPAERKKLLNLCDVAFLCLPDAASREAVELIDNPDTRVIDSSTAFRCAPGWIYGFPELNKGQREKIRAAGRVAVPGCYATGFIAAAAPLVKNGVISPDCPVAANAVSGYTGGGKKLIGVYEDKDRKPGDARLKSLRLYGLGLAHKHLPEMTKYSGLSREPMFVPSVGDYAQGMLVSVPLDARLMSKSISPRSLRELYAEYYEGERFIKVMPYGGEGSLYAGFLDAVGCNGTNMLEIFVFGAGSRALVVSRLDNLGKGASGAAVQCMNIMLGLEESAGL